jgi:tryptophan synthase beta chain
MGKLKKILLSESDMPTHWYNINADLPAAGIQLPPALHPGTGQPLGPGDLAPLFPMALIMQEVSQERYIEIPDEVQDVYRIWRPTPLIRAYEWEKALGTPAKIYYKYEGGSPSGSHKPNTAVPQAYYNMKEASSAWLLRRALVSGAVRSASPARCTGWNAKCIWCG